MKKFWEVLLNSTIYRVVSLVVQLAMVSAIFGLITNWKVVVACNLVCFIWYVVYHMLVIKVRRRNKTQLKECTTSDRRIKLYCSHAIRGSKGDNPPCDIQMSNCEIAKQAVDLIKGRFPNLDIYVPANAEAFVYQTYSRGLLTDTQVLEIDCHILSGCDGVIVYDFDKSKGVEIEVKYAIDHGIPVFRFKKINQETINGIGDFIRSIDAKIVDPLNGQ